MPRHIKGDRCRRCGIFTRDGYRLCEKCIKSLDWNSALDYINGKQKEVQA